MQVIPPLTDEDIKAMDQRNRERAEQVKRELAERYVAHPVNYVKRKGGDL